MVMKISLDVPEIDGFILAENVSIAFSLFCQFYVSLYRFSVMIFQPPGMYPRQA